MVSAVGSDAVSSKRANSAVFSLDRIRRLNGGWPRKSVTRITLESAAVSVSSAAHNVGAEKSPRARTIAAVKCFEYRFISYLSNG
jgi:hypothetical protein